MSRPQRINIWAIQNRTSGGARKPYVVRWTVDGKPRSRAFGRKKEADAYVARLKVAQLDGAQFSTFTGEPVSWGGTSGSTVSVAAWCQQWFDREAPTMKPRSRTSLAESFSRALPFMVRPSAPEPPADIRPQIRRWLDDFSSVGVPAGRSAMPDYLRRWSLPLGELDKTTCIEAFSAMSRRVSTHRGAKTGVVSATVRNRYRACMSQVLAAAVEEGLLDEQLWPAAPKGKRRVSQQPKQRTIDVKKLPTVAQALECVGMMSNRQPQSEAFVILGTIMALAGLRPSEAIALCIENIELPDEGWGRIDVLESANTPGQFTLPDERIGSTKTGINRYVPIPPRLVAALRDYIGDRTEGLVAPSREGTPVLLGSWERAWKHIRPNDDWVLYSLRHACATAWIRANPGGIKEIARRLGHSPAVLTERYAGVFDDDEERMNGLIEESMPDLGP